MSNELTLKSNTIFRTYSESNGKGPIYRYRDGQHIANYEDCLDLDSFCGILNSDIVLIDFDDEEMGEKVQEIIEEQNIACRIHKTDNGYHFFFRNGANRVEKQYTKVFLACGVEADIKIGRKNGVACLKKDGVLRTPVYDQYTVLGDYEEIPCWLLPIDNKNRELFDMSTGERNDTLFRYKNVLAAHGLSIDEIRETYKIINEYILWDSLSKKELEDILRESAFPKDLVYQNGRFAHEVIGDVLIRELYIRRSGSNLFSYNGAYYENNDDIIKKNCIKKYKPITERQRKEVLSYISTVVDSKTLIPSDDYVCFANGLLNIHTGELEQFSPYIMLFNQIPHKYMPDAYNGVLDNAINSWCSNDRELRMLLEEFIGYIFLSNTKAQKSLFICGDKNMGKSTLLNYLIKYFGNENVTTLSLHDECSKFQPWYLQNKLANICNDISSRILSEEEISIFKQLVTGDYIKVEKKGGESRFKELYATQVFSCNRLPSMRDETGEIGRRIIVFPFLTDMTGKEDRNLEEKICRDDGYEYLTKIAVDGLLRLVRNNYKFTESKLSEEYTKKYLSHIDTVEEFAKAVINEEYINICPVADIYKDYRRYCNDNNIDVAQRNTFSRELQRLLKVKETPRKNSDGTSARFYRKC